MFSTGAHVHVVSNVASNDHALENQIYVLPDDPLAGKIVRIWQLSGDKQHACKGVYKVGASPDHKLPPAVDLQFTLQFSVVGVSGAIRKFALLNVKDFVRLEPVQLPSAALVMLRVKRLRPATNMEVSFDTETELDVAAKRLQGWPAPVDFELFIRWYDMILTFTVVSVSSGKDMACKEALIDAKTEFSFESGQPFLHIKGSQAMMPLFKTGGLDLSTLGIGGLDDQFAEIFRGAFASRAVPPDLAKRLNLQHNKGILLFGPPGTGKTLIARQLGKLLNSVEPKVVNGPEILDKYVGESEKKVRELFADAERDEKAHAEQSPLHVIIFDEIDAICKQRGTVGGGTGVHDSIVNTLLTKIDGVDALNNILLIGMTNRPDLLDDALTRPGRLELQVEIGLPDERGRLQVLQIHSRDLRKEGLLGEDVNLEELASLTMNFTGAELQALVRKATYTAIDVRLDKSDLKGVPKDFRPVVEMEHFAEVLATMKPAFGAAQEALSQYCEYGMLHYGPRFERVLSHAEECCNLSEAEYRASILLLGAPGTGKTSLAVHLAQKLEFPLVKVVELATLQGKSEAGIVDALNKAFSDAYKSTLSLVILDNLGHLLQFGEVGLRYSLQLTHAVQRLLLQKPPKGRRCVVMVTADPVVVATLKLRPSFTHVFEVPELTRGEAIAALRDSGLASDAETLQRAVDVMPPESAFQANIRQLSMALAHCTSAGQLDMRRWENVQGRFAVSDEWDSNL